VSRFEPGAVVALREVWRGRVWKARAAIVVRDDEELVGLWTPAGSPMVIADTGSGVPSASWRLVPFAAEWDALRLSHPGARRVHVALWRDGAFDGWKIDIVRPLRPFAAGFEYLDLELDVRVPPDGDASIVDEDEFAESQRRGVIDELEAPAVRREAEAALDSVRLGSALVGAWDGWSPPEGCPPGLPDGWDAPGEDLPPLR
jgi:hypothetical protein